MQEVPSEEFRGKAVAIGPILRISCSGVVEFLKPVMIQLPVSLRDEQLDIPDVSKCRVRVLFLRFEEERKEWVEITDELNNSTSFDGKTVRFQVLRFSGYELIELECVKEMVIVHLILITSSISSFIYITFYLLY